MQEAPIDANENLTKSAELSGKLSAKEPVSAVTPEGAEPNPEENNFFTCNICYDVAVNPVVTLCGHLYCWPCLYRWIKVQRLSRTCPVCKAGVEGHKVIPIYGRGGDDVDPRTLPIHNASAEPVPARPLGQRPTPATRAPVVEVQQAQQGLHLVPALFGLQPTMGMGSEDLTQEQQHQAFLSRLLLMLGSFVIMCLLLF